MVALLKKEFSLAMHPITPLMVLLSAMVLIPNYPYVVVFFYVSMAIFFTCLLGRENNDVVYSLNLPIRKSNIVKARFLFAVLIQFAQLVLMLPFVALRAHWNMQGNQAGIDANISLFGVAFLVYALFNLVFFSNYYKNVNKVGVAFVKSSILIFIWCAFDVAATYTIPFVKNYLEGKNTEFLPVKLGFTAVCAILYIVVTIITCKISVRNFEKQDLH